MRRHGTGARRPSGGCPVHARAGRLHAGNSIPGQGVAARAIAPGDTIVKYHCPIGLATDAIAPGHYVHVHNVKSGDLPTYVLPTP